jgi:hypothetical protein
VIAGCADLETAADALDAELWLAANVWAIRAEAPDDESFDVAMLDLVDVAERDGRGRCLVLLRAMAAAGPQGPAEPAARAAERLAARTAPGADGVVGLPGWVDTVAAPGLEALLGAGSTGIRPAAPHALCVPPARGGRG